MLPAHVFREYDIRGLVDDELTDEVVDRIARALALRVRRSGGGAVVLGRDCRLSSDRFRRVFSRALCACGVDVIDVGQVPTPLVYYSAHVLQSVGGLVAIASSYNPPEYNGFELGVDTATLFVYEIHDLRYLAEAGDFSVGQGEVRELELLSSYLDDDAGRISLDWQSQRVVV